MKLAPIILITVAAAATIPKSEVKILGPIDYGQTIHTRYSGPPKYRAYDFNGRPGDHIEIWIHARRGSPEAFLTDGDFQSLAGGSARFSATIPADSKPATYYIVFRGSAGGAEDLGVELERPSK